MDGTPSPPPYGPGSRCNSPGTGGPRFAGPRGPRPRLHLGGRQHVPHVEIEVQDLALDHAGDLANLPVSGARVPWRIAERPIRLEIGLLTWFRMLKGSATGTFPPAPYARSSRGVSAGRPADRGTLGHARPERQRRLRSIRDGLDSSQSPEGFQVIYPQIPRPSSVPLLRERARVRGRFTHSPIHPFTGSEQHDVVAVIDLVVIVDRDDGLEVLPFARIRPPGGQPGRLSWTAGMSSRRSSPWASRALITCSSRWRTMSWNWRKRRHSKSPAGRFRAGRHRAHRVGQGAEEPVNRAEVLERACVAAAFSAFPPHDLLGLACGRVDLPADGRRHLLDPLSRRRGPCPRASALRRPRRRIPARAPARAASIAAFKARRFVWSAMYPTSSAMFWIPATSSAIFPTSRGQVLGRLP